MHDERGQMPEPLSQKLPELSAKKAAAIRDLLRDKKARDAERAFVLEGRKPILELLRTHASALLEIVVARWVLERGDPTVTQALAQAKVPVSLCRDHVFEQMSAVTTGQGMLAIVRKTEWDESAILGRPQVMGILGESLQDPTNVGAIARTALAFGIDGLWLTADSADVYGPKVVRGTAGAIMKLPLFVGERVDELVERFARQGCVVLAADPSSRRTMSIRDIGSIPARAMLAFGNESRGLSEAVLKRAAIRFHIPVSRGVESLNVAASAAIAAFYFSALPKESAGERR
jgi:TrmH family RNA methyltransferase